MAEEGDSSTSGNNNGDSWRPHSGKVAPAEEQIPKTQQSSNNESSRKPLQKKLAFLDVRLRKSVIEEEETPPDGQKTSIKIKIYLIIVAAGGIALGVGLTYYGSQKNLTDFLVIGIGSIIVGVICFGVCIGLIIRERLIFGKPSRKSGKEELFEEPLEAEELPRYFVPPSDTTAETVYRQRRPSTVQLYGARSNLNSAGHRSDGVLTTTGLDLDDRSDMGSPRSDKIQTPPTPQVTYPMSALDTERVYSKVGLEKEQNPGVFTAPITITSASKDDTFSSLESIENEMASRSNRPKNSNGKTMAHGDGPRETVG